LPSRFVDELPEEHVEVVSKPGLYGASADRLASHSRFDGSRLQEDTYYDNPGWRRARAASQRGATPPLIEARANEVSVSSSTAAKFAIGEKVFHQKFGYGHVTTVEGQKLTVDFQHSGSKKVVDTFLQKA
jgi:DNA helicase-2/ATP-dependent DNA helicase PcrA